MPNLRKTNNSASPLSQRVPSTAGTTSQKTPSTAGPLSHRVPSSAGGFLATRAKTRAGTHRSPDTKSLLQTSAFNNRS